MIKKYKWNKEKIIMKKYFYKLKTKKVIYIRNTLRKVWDIIKYYMDFKLVMIILVIHQIMIRRFN